MFGFKKAQEKEYISCEWLQAGIHFTPNGLYHCCMSAHSNGNNKPISGMLNGNKYNFEDFHKLYDDTKPII